MSVPGEDALNWIRQEIAEYEPQLPPRPPYAHPLIESLRFLLRLAEDNDHQIEQLQARIQELETEQNERWRPLTDLIEAQKARIQELEADRKWLSEEAFGLCGIITRHHDVKVLDLEPGARCPICRDKTPATLVRTIQVYLERRGH